MKHAIIPVCALAAACGVAAAWHGRQINMADMPKLALIFAAGCAADALAAIAAVWSGWVVQRRSERRCSALVTELTPQLLGEYGPYVIDAATRLGMANDPTAVPVLMRALESYVEAQRPGWRDVAEVIVETLGRLGDRRALHLLRRLETVRGIGFIGALRAAIASIEPQTSLLRPGVLTAHTLLRPSKSTLDQADREELIRPTAELEPASAAALGQVQR